MGIRHILVNMLKPGYFPIMFNKVLKRLKEPNPAVIKQQATAWYAQRAEDTHEFIKRVDPTLFDESVSFNQALQQRGQEVISKLPVKMGGGGNCILLYFLARHLRPAVIVETGVSMGFSSQTFLSAIRKNQKGHLYSSDFPYFRLPEPEKYIGCVVEEHLKKDWTLLIDGDQKNLPVIASSASKIELFHYDSDKSYSGRTEALKTLRPNLDGNSTIVFDDIGDNFHFRDWVEKEQLPYRILKNPAGGFVGLTGTIAGARS